jgi:hypothetical protein
MGLPARSRLPLHVNERRRRVDLGERRRIAWLADRGEVGAESFGRGKLRFSLVLAIETDVVRAAPARQNRQGIGRPRRLRTR